MDGSAFKVHDRCGDHIKVHEMEMGLFLLSTAMGLSYRS
jgi:hypothetical protein